MTNGPHSPIRLVLSDMDGTILSSERKISLKTQKAVKQLRQKGVAVALVSARPPEGMMPYIRQLNLEGPCAAFNGGIIFKADGTLQKDSVFSSPVVKNLLTRLESCGGELWFQNKERWLVRDATHVLVRNESRIIGVKPHEVPDLYAETAHVNRIIAIGYEPEIAERLERELGEEYAGYASVLRSTPTKINITPADATKGHALKTLAAMYGVAPAQVACLGDAQNDLPMLREAGMSIAMGQAPDGVKQKARYVTRSNAEDGWADATERFIMPRVLHS